MDDAVSVRTANALDHVVERLAHIEEKIDVLMSALQQSEYREEIARVRQNAKDRVRSLNP